MATIPKKVQERLAAGIKHFQPILLNAKTRDLGEADTVRIITDMLADVFGYDKYSDITSELAIRGTYCDIATRLDGKVQSLIEAKAIGIELKDAHIKQAVDYAANQGVEWVVLTTGIVWRVYKVSFTKPIDHDLVIEFNFCELNWKKDEDLEKIFLLAKEAWSKSVLGDYHEQKQALSRYYLGAMFLTDPVLEVARRELRRLSPDVRIDIEQIRQVLETEVLKREVLEGPKSEEARKRIAKCLSRSLRAKAAKECEPETNAANPEKAPPQAAINPPPTVVTPPSSTQQPTA